MDVVEFRPTPEQYAWTFGGVPPVATVKPGTLLKLWTEDAFAGRLRSVEDLPSLSLKMPDVNPQTGPFHVAGAEPGDTLAVHFVSIEPARDWAASSTIPFFGGLSSTDRTMTIKVLASRLQAGGPRRYAFDVANGGTAISNAASLAVVQSVDVTAIGFNFTRYKIPRSAARLIKLMNTCALIRERKVGPKSLKKRRGISQNPKPTGCP